MTYPKIKPCPYCERDEYLAVYSYDCGSRHVECTACNYLGPACTSIGWAIKHHNAEREERRRRHREALARKESAS